MNIQIKILNKLSVLPKGSLLLLFIGIINVFLGFAREATVAYFFGASKELDSFLVALAIPKFLTVNIAQLTVAVVLPVYIGYREKGDSDTASLLLKAWLRFSVLVMTGLGVVLFIAAIPLMHLLAPGFDYSQQAQSAHWLRVLLPYAWVLAVAGTFKVVLDTRQKFFAPAISPTILSVSIIVFTALFYSYLGVMALAWGFTFGALIGFIVQFIVASKFEPGLLNILKKDKKMVLPLAAGGAMLLQSASQQINILVDRGFASTLDSGSVSALNYAQTINSIPTALLTSAIATAIFPILSKMVASGNMQQAFKLTVKWSIVLVLLLIIPILIMVFFRESLVSLLFKRGAFTQDAVHITSSVMLFLPWIILTTIVSTLFSRLLLSQNKASLVAVASIAAVIIKVIFSYLFIPHYGLKGLVIATLIASILATIIRVIMAYQLNISKRLI